MSVLSFLIPFASLIIGLGLLISEKIHEKLLENYKSYFLKMNGKNLIIVCPLLLAITLFARHYCLHLADNNTILTITLIVIQLFIVFHFTVLTNLTRTSDLDEDGNLILE